MSVLSLTATPQNQQILCNMVWSAGIPNSVSDYVIFYYITGSRQVKSISTTAQSVTIANLTNGTSYNFRCVAYIGSYTSGTRLTETPLLANIIPGNIPNVPTNLLAVVSSVGNVIDGQVNLSWTIPTSDPHYAITEYTVYQSTDNATFTLQSNPTTNAASITSLTDGNTYYFRVSASNAIGESAYVSVSAIPLGVATVPLNFVVTFDNNSEGNQNNPGYNSVDLTWAAPSFNGGSGISSYSILYSLDPSFVTNVFQTSSTITSDTIQNSSLIIPYANQSTSTGWYYFKVFANNSIGPGQATSAATIMPVQLPAAINSLSVTNLDANGNHASGTISLAWNYAVDSGCPLLGFIIDYLDECNNLKSIYVSDMTTTPKFTICGLQNGTSYTFTIIAINMMGSGLDTSIDIIPSTIPSAPSIILTHGNSNMSIAITNGNSNGNAITSSNIYRSTDNINFTNIGNTSNSSYLDSSLTNGTVYYYKVTNVNANGEGAFSAVEYEHPSTIPNAISSGIVSTNVNHLYAGNELRIDFTQNVNDLSINGGDTITSFNIYREISGSNSFTFLTSLTPESSNYYVDDGVSNGVSYMYGVTCINRDGEGARALSNCLSPSGLPDAPSLNSVINSNASSSGHQATLNFSANGDEGSSILSYNIYRGNVQIATGQPLAAYVDTGLNNAQQYCYAVTAVNANGESVKSNVVMVTPSGLPDTPTGLAGTHDNMIANLSWNLLNVGNSSPCDEGSAIIHYIISQKNSPNGSYNVIATLSSSTSSYQVTGLQNGNIVWFEIKAVNSNGSSAYSSAITVTPSTSPSVVQTVLITSEDSELSISFQPPSNTGGLAFQYNISVTDSNNVVQFSAVTSNLTTTVNNLVDNASYVVSIYAFNNVDTNYNIYTHTSSIVPIPIPVSNLVWNNSDPQQISVSWTYDTVKYSVYDYTIVCFDETQNISMSVTLDAFTANANDVIVSGTPYQYTFYLNASDLANTSFALSDQCNVVVFARNVYGLSKISNTVLINITA